MVDLVALLVVFEAVDARLEAELVELGPLAPGEGRPGAARAGKHLGDTLGLGLARQHAGRRPLALERPIVVRGVGNGLRFSLRRRRLHGRARQLGRARRRRGTRGHGSRRLDLVLRRWQIQGDGFSVEGIADDPRP